MSSDAFSFAQPWWLLALLIVPLVAWMQGGRGALSIVCRRARTESRSDRHQRFLE